MINLSPPEVRENIKYGRLNVRVLKYLMGIGFLAVLIAATIFTGIRITDTKRVELEAELATRNGVFDEYADTLSEAADLSSTINTIKVLLDREIKFSEFLREIANLIPVGATLDGISLTSEQDTLQLTASMNSKEKAPILQKNLLSSDLFTVVDLVSITGQVEAETTAVYSVVFNSGNTITAEEAAAEAAAEAEAAQ